MNTWLVAETETANYVGMADELIREAQALISAGEDATHLLEKLQHLVLDEPGEPGSAQDDDPSRAERRAKRSALKAQRAELRVMLARLDSELSRTGDGASLKSGSSVRSAQSVHSSASKSAVPRPALQLKPPILDPKEIVPEHVREQFRAEFRAARAAEAESAEPRKGGGGSRQEPRRPTPSTRAAAATPTIEELQEKLGVRAAPPPGTPDVRSMTHGGGASLGSASRRAFVTFPGAESSEKDPGQASPSKRRTVANHRAAQSSMGVLLSGEEK